MRNRAFRRAKMINKKRKARAMLLPFSHNTDNTFKEPSVEAVGFRARTPTVCSCPGCGNPRKKLKKGQERYTIQERKMNAKCKYGDM